MLYPGTKERSANGIKGELMIWNNTLIFRVYRPSPGIEYKDYLVNKESLEVIIEDGSAALYDASGNSDGYLDESTEASDWHAKFFK